MTYFEVMMINFCSISLTSRNAKTAMAVKTLTAGWQLLAKYKTCVSSNEFTNGLKIVTSALQL